MTITHICRTPMIRKWLREWRDSWCFACRRNVLHHLFLLVPKDPYSYYGPAPSVRCGRCWAMDGDLFPGQEREWEE